MQIFSANGAKLLELLIFYYFLTYMCALGARARVARNFPYNFLEKYPEIFQDILEKIFKNWFKNQSFFRVRHF